MSEQMDPAGGNWPDDAEGEEFFEEEFFEEEFPDEELDQELDRRLWRLEWPVAPDAVRDRSLVAVLARQTALADPDGPQSG